jgi:NAD(P)-dependent dehydrogenase (short-subunit alcohol dehydrogenase family)
MATQPRSLSGKVVAITGGGRGIGRSIAEALTREGARVAIGDLDLESAERTASALGSNAIALGLDVTDHAGFTAFLDEVERTLGPLDVLVNNAGIMPVTPLAEESSDSIARQLDINLHAVIHGTQEAMRRMVPRGTGHIVNVASSAGKTPFPNLATYCATKYGVVGLSEAVRLELRDTGVEISVLMPGIVKTELATGLVDNRTFKSSTPEEVADAVLGALRSPRFDVFVPRSIGPAWAFTNLLPRRGRDVFARVFQVDRPLREADRSARAAYEQRAAASAPAADAVIAESAAEPEAPQEAAA